MSETDSTGRSESHQLEEPNENEVADFRMITFTLGGRDYGIDIMEVKEISQVPTFTHVPNTAAYVRGVYNLRGEIISIIDLRIMFNLEPEESNRALEDVIFLRSEDHIIGVVVDEVKDVVGVSSDRIQDPHPIFGGINIRYIRGVVEHGETLFVILDPELAFGDEFEVEASVASEAVLEPEAELEEAELEGLDFTFVAEALQTIGGFYPTGLNQVWLRSRFESWESERAGANSSAQITNSAESDSFLGPFFSSFEGGFWPDDYVHGVSDLLPEIDGANVRAWVIGAGNGREAFSVACLLRSRFPEKVITVFAHDADLLNISSASTLSVDSKAAPGAIAQYLIEGSRGFVFSDEIRQSISFEYHDVLHDNTFPQVDLIVARDYLSFLAEIPRKKLMDDIYEKVSERGIVFVGANEVLPDDTYEPIASGPARGFRKLK